MRNVNCNGGAYEQSDVCRRRRLAAQPEEDVDKIYGRSQWFNGSMVFIDPHLVRDLSEILTVRLALLGMVEFAVKLCQNCGSFFGAQPVGPVVRGVIYILMICVASPPLAIRS